MLRAVTAAIVLFAASGLRAAEPVVEVVKLDNGIIVVAVHVPASPVAHCRVACAPGLAHDPAGLEGAAELLRRCSYHGTAILGTTDPEKEERTLALIERQEDGVRRRLASVPEETLRKIRDYPVVSRVLRSDVADLLRRIASRDPSPMSRPEMDEIADGLKSKTRLIDDLEIEMERIYRDQAFGTITLVRDIEESILKNREALAALRVPDPVRAEYEKGGAFSNSSETLRDLTMYSSSLPSERVELFFWLESRRLSGPVFRFFDEEKAAYPDRSAALLSANTLAGMFDEATFSGSALGRPAVPASVEAIDANTLASFRERAFSPSSTVVVVAGGVEPARVFSLAARYFGPIPSRQPATEQPAPPDAAPLLWNVFAGYGSATLRFGLPASNSPDMPALEILAAHLSTPASALFKATVDSGLAAKLRVRVLESAVAGIFEVRAVAAPGVRPLSLATALKGGLAQSLDEPLSASAILSAAASAELETATLASEPSALADKVALFTARRGAAPSKSRFDGLTPDRIMEIAKKHLTDRPVTVIVTEEDR